MRSIKFGVPVPREWEGLTFSEIFSEPVGPTRVIRLAIDVTAMVRAPETKVADLQALVVELHTAVRELTRQQAAATASQPPGLALSAYRWTVAGAVGTWIQVLLALLMMAQTAVADAEPAPPPSVTVIVQGPDATEIERTVDERLRGPEDNAAARGHDRRGIDR
jgi:hypothetical protein